MSLSKLPRALALGFYGLVAAAAVVTAGLAIFVDSGWFIAAILVLAFVVFLAANDDRRAQEAEQAAEPVTAFKPGRIPMQVTPESSLDSKPGDF